MPSPARVQERETWRRRRLRVPAERRRGGRRRKGWEGGSTMEGDTEGRESMRIQMDLELKKREEKRSWEGREKVGVEFVKLGKEIFC